MTVDAAHQNIGQDLCDAYKRLKGSDFDAYAAKIRTKLSDISCTNGSTSRAIPATFPNMHILSTLLSPMVSPDKKLYTLQTSRYTLSKPLSISNNLSGMMLAQSSQTILRHLIRKGLVLRLLIDHRDEPITSIPTMLWEINHFVSIMFRLLIYLKTYLFILLLQSPSSDDLGYSHNLVMAKVVVDSKALSILWEISAGIPFGEVLFTKRVYELMLPLSLIEDVPKSLINTLAFV